MLKIFPRQPNNLIGYFHTRRIYCIPQHNFPYPMPAASIFLDESGDLGWTLDKPHLKGGSSRFIVLAAIVVPDGKNDPLERIVRGMYKRRDRKAHKELKSTALNGHERASFAKELVKLKGKHPGFSFHAVVAEKGNVPDPLRNKTEVFYNHMAERMLHDTIAKYDRIEFFPDARVVKPSDTHALHNYLETRLAIEGHEVDIVTEPCDSGCFREIQAADYLASIVWAKYEENNPLFDKELLDAVQIIKLY